MKKILCALFIYITTSFAAKAVDLYAAPTQKEFDTMPLIETDEALLAYLKGKGCDLMIKDIERKDFASWSPKKGCYKNCFLHIKNHLSDRQAFLYYAKTMFDHHKNKKNKLDDYDSHYDGKKDFTDCLTDFLVDKNMSLIVELWHPFLTNHFLNTCLVTYLGDYRKENNLEYESCLSDWSHKNKDKALDFFTNYACFFKFSYFGSETTNDIMHYIVNEQKRLLKAGDLDVVFKLLHKFEKVVFLNENFLISVIQSFADIKGYETKLMQYIIRNHESVIKNMTFDKIESFLNALLFCNTESDLKSVSKKKYTFFLRQHENDEKSCLMLVHFLMKREYTRDELVELESLLKTIISKKNLAYKAYEKIVYVYKKMHYLSPSIQFEKIKLAYKGLIESADDYEEKVCLDSHYIDYIMFVWDRNPNDINIANKAINYFKKTKRLDKKSNAECLFRSYEIKYNHYGKASDLTKAIEYCEKASESTIINDCTDLFRLLKQQNKTEDELIDCFKAKKKIMENSFYLRKVSQAFQDSGLFKGALVFYQHLFDHFEHDLISQDFLSLADLTKALSLLKGDFQNQLAEKIIPLYKIACDKCFYDDKLEAKLSLARLYRDYPAKGKSAIKKRRKMATKLYIEIKEMPDDIDDARSKNISNKKHKRFLVKRFEAMLELAQAYHYGQGVFFCDMKESEKYYDLVIGKAEFMLNYKQKILDSASKTKLSQKDIREHEARINQLEQTLRLAGGMGINVNEESLNYAKEQLQIRKNPMDDIKSFIKLYKDYIKRAYLLKGDLYVLHNELNKAKDIYKKALRSGVKEAKYRLKQPCFTKSMPKKLTSWVCIINHYNKDLLDLKSLEDDLILAQKLCEDYEKCDRSDKYKIYFDFLSKYKGKALGKKGKLDKFKKLVKFCKNGLAEYQEKSDTNGKIEGFDYLQALYESDFKNLVNIMKQAPKAIPENLFVLAEKDTPKQADEDDISEENSWEDSGEEVYIENHETLIPAVLLDQDEQKIFEDDEDGVRETETAKELKEDPKSSVKSCQSLVDFDGLAECIGLKKLGTSFITEQNSPIYMNLLTPQAKREFTSIMHDNQFRKFVNNLGVFGLRQCNFMAKHSKIVSKKYGNSVMAVLHPSSNEVADWKLYKKRLANGNRVFFIYAEKKDTESYKTKEVCVLFVKFLGHSLMLDKGVKIK